MKILRRVVQGALGFLFLAPLLFSAEVKSATLAYNYDVDSGTLTYVRMLGTNGDAFQGPMLGPGTIKTVGASTTVTENVAGTNPFTDVEAGDVLIIPLTPTTSSIRVVVAKASAASITVDSSIDLSAGKTWRWFDTQAGTTLTDGWVDVSSYDTVTMMVQYDQGDLDALDVRWECKSAAIGAAPVNVYPGETSDCGPGGTLATDRCEFATAGATARLAVQVEQNTFSACRVGLAFKAADASDVGANLEKVTVTITKMKPGSGQ